MPRHPDDAFLFELDLDENFNFKFHEDRDWVKFTERAEKAQAAKWQRLYKMFGPVKALESSRLASDTHKPPRVAFGWGFTESFLHAYAKHYKLAIDCRPYLCEQLGRDFLVYGELTDEEAADPELGTFLDGWVREVVHADLEAKSGIELTFCYPFTDKYDGMFALYTNYDAKRRHAEIQVLTGIKKAVEMLGELMNQFGNSAELLWWYDSSTLKVDLNSPY
ncbi:hypothetical protein C8Q76DRAFT_211801 [Earliella scabrosa]|nr:hypothetical protein C8Q76DRAFT_211801 [Earliella scabrosa]